MNGTEHKKQAWIKVVAITLSFWAIIFIGPFALWLLNAISIIRYREGELGYLLFAIASQGIACGAALAVASKISDGKHKMTVVVNGAVCATLASVLTLLDILRKDGIENIISGCVSVLVLIVGSVIAFKTHAD